MNETELLLKNWLSCQGFNQKQGANFLKCCPRNFQNWIKSNTIPLPILRKMGYQIAVSGHGLEINI